MLSSCVANTNDFPVLKEYHLFGKSEEHLRKSMEYKQTDEDGYPDPDCFSGFYIETPTQNIEKITFVFNRDDHLFLIEYVYRFDGLLSVEEVINILEKVYGKPRWNNGILRQNGTRMFLAVIWETNNGYVRLDKLSSDDGEVTIIHENWPYGDTMSLPSRV
jgi:hypothetical protein